MTPEEKDKFAKAYRRWVNDNPDADKPIDNFYMNGEQMTPRKLVELELQKGRIYQDMDAFLEFAPGLTVDNLIEMTFGPQYLQDEPKVEPKIEPPPAPKKPLPPTKRWNI